MTSFPIQRCAAWSFCKAELLSKFSQSRDNNFNLIRIFAALAVLISHSVVLATGEGEAEPFRASLGITLGSIAVDIFFITSGFLVTASILTKKSVIEFFLARVLRVFPALMVVVLITVFGLGLFFTSLSPFSYLSNSKTYIYLLKCTTLITGVVYNLPGVFEGNPYKSAVNGSLWSMPYEMRMYVILAALWVALRTSNRVGLRLFELAIVAGACVAGVLIVAIHFYLPADNHFLTLFYMFFSGAAFFVIKDHIRLSNLLFCSFLVTLLIAATVNKEIFFVVYKLTAAYLLFYLAYVPSGWVRKYNKFGDYSYGVYVYAFPVQQSIAALFPGISIYSMLLISATATLVLAMFSWHFIERRALAQKDFCVEFYRKIILARVTGAAERPR